MNRGQKIIAFISLLGIATAVFLAVFDLSRVFDDEIDLSGEWFFEFHTRQSTYSDYVGVMTSYKMHLLQDGNKIDANGETWTHDGKALPYREHQPLIVTGIFKNDSIKCNYTLKGGRETVGSFVARYHDGKLIGTFSGTGADVKGKFVAQRSR